jgi:hypothetical protein
MTMRPLRRIAFLLEEFSTPSPAQQLLDRFLVGYPRDGQWHKFDDVTISAYLAVTSESDFGSRVEEHDLVIASTVERAIENADAVVIVPRRPGALANEDFVKLALELAPEGGACFVHGTLANSDISARAFAAQAAKRTINLLAGTAMGVTWRLPPIEVPADTPLTEALIVVQVSTLFTTSSQPASAATLAGAELNALEGLLPRIEKRRGGESGVRAVRWMEGRELWRAGDKGQWSWPLLAAALSRSHTPQGDPVTDGRTQDLVGLGLVPKLARNPRGWLIEHRDGMRSAILVLDGVIADTTFALRAKDGPVFSAQLFRAPPPIEQHFSLLAAALEDLFRTGQSPWPLQRGILVAGLLETFRNSAAKSGRPFPVTGNA